MAGTGDADAADAHKSSTAVNAKEKERLRELVSASSCFELYPGADIKYLASAVVDLTSRRRCRCGGRL